MRYFVEPVVCDYGIYRLDDGNRKLIEICNVMSNAEMVAEILNSDDKHEVWSRPQGEWILLDGTLFHQSRFKCSNCGHTITCSQGSINFYRGCYCGAIMKGASTQ